MWWPKFPQYQLTIGVLYGKFDIGIYITHRTGKPWRGLGSANPTASGLNFQFFNPLNVFSTHVLTPFSKVDSRADRLGWFVIVVGYFAIANKSILAIIDGYSFFPNLTGYLQERRHLSPRVTSVAILISVANHDFIFKVKNFPIDLITQFTGKIHKADPRCSGERRYFTPIPVPNFFGPSFLGPLLAGFPLPVLLRWPHGFLHGGFLF